MDLEHGRYGGRAVDIAVLDNLVTQRNETLLRRFNDRLPSKELREQARRGVIRLKIAASAYPEVRDDVARVEERLLQQGVNRIPLPQQPASKASLDRQKVAMRGVLVRQDLSHQTATLLGTGDRPGVSVLPELSLLDALWVEVAGVSHPVTLCRAPGMLDPSPCIGADDVKIESPLAYLDRGGAFRFVDHVSAYDAAALARAGHALALPVSVGGRRLLTFQWPLWFERPQNLVLSGTAPERARPEGDRRQHGPVSLLVHRQGRQARVPGGRGEGRPGGLSHRLARRDGHPRVRRRERLGRLRGNERNRRKLPIDVRRRRQPG